MTALEQNRKPSPGETERSWGRFMVLGVLLVVLGLLAFGQLVLATLASMVIIAALMILAGVAHIVLAFSKDSRQRLLLLLAAGLLYLLAGAVTFANPLLASIVLTLLIAVSLFAAGAARIWFGIKVRPKSGWGWIVATGAVTLLLGGTIALTWPINSLWVIGIFLGVDLVMQGASYIAFACATRARDQRRAA